MQRKLLKLKKIVVNNLAQEQQVAVPADPFRPDASLQGYASCHVHCT